MTPPIIEGVFFIICYNFKMFNNFRKKINTKSVSGFPEFTPEKQRAFDDIKKIIDETFSNFGFVSIDTPVMERQEILLAKAGGETEQQIYTLKKGDEELALRFDLTVPLSRYVVDHYNDLTFPFRRKQIAKVYRGERPQKGRFREFYQADIDIIGDGELSISNDAEMVGVVNSVFNKLNFGKFIIRVSNRKILNGLLEELNITEKTKEVLRIIDKLDKIGKPKAQNELKLHGISDLEIQKIFELIEISGNNKEVLDSLEKLDIENDQFKLGFDEIKYVYENAILFNVKEENLKIDLKIARGLDYYTGTIYETNLIDFPKLGSVCSGGRYDDLSGKYTSKKLPGVGLSIGLTRLFSQLEETNLINFKKESQVKVLIVSMINDLSFAIKTANNLRENNIPTQIYFESKKIDKRLKYADNLNIPFVIIVGEDEIKSNKLTIKNLSTGKQEKIGIEKIVSYIKKC